MFENDLSLLLLANQLLHIYRLLLGVCNSLIESLFEHVPLAHTGSDLVLVDKHCVLDHFNLIHSQLRLIKVYLNIV